MNPFAIVGTVLFSRAFPQQQIIVEGEEAVAATYNTG